MAAEQSERIKLWGIVQGVGFRPYVAKTAAQLGMKGQVLNIGGLVEITVTDTPLRITEFIDTLIKNKPVPAEIVHIKRESVSYREFDSFTIIKSGAGDDEAAMLPSDLAICPDCLQELYDSENPRYRHPFISCMVCGPRYTIIDRIPYDRENTSMVDFPMCSFCESQYTALNDRRYHAQTISCHECGPQLIWKENQHHAPDSGIDQISGSGDFSSASCKAAHIRRDAAVLDHAAEILRSGGVIAFKSVGGYNLLADPLNDEAVTRLRKIKNREAKPFAVMFRDTDQIKEFCFVNDTEEKLLNSSARPIILLEHRDLPYDEIRRSRFIGSFLPSFAAQYMLLDRISPLIFTSANLSDMPMIKDESEMEAMMAANPLIDGMIYNTRQIRVRADDSVVRVIDDQPQMIRRSKGYVPVPLYIDSAPSGKTMIFAAGSQLKNSFALTKGPFTYISQFFGDMDTVENQQLYENNVSRLKELFRVRPEAVVCDMHPLYYTTVFAEKYAAENGLPLIKVQHHHAHVASVMAENDLKGKVIGVSFDGTGYGTDDHIWGGEFFLCENGDTKRMSHLKYIDMIGGDASVKDARRSALSYIHAFENGYMSADPPGADIEGSREIAVDISDIIAYGRERLLSMPDAKLVTAALRSGINTVKSSSMGRLFDGVSSLLGIKDHNDYEGQCAIMLEDAAAFAQKHPGADPASDLALAFHQSVIDMIIDQCMTIRDESGASQVALTGGTFQNKILMEGVLKKLRSRGFSPYYNISVSPNDGGIALGQAYIAMHRLRLT
ncbi:Carbamoyltransferase hypF [uncultured Eubacterium sp.]|uniref:carbamoyltransferase HypF n=1 Tax=Brotomerdimonas butyrica TaxID=2981721 RepID=UPI0008209A19|nr:carbamoyltransferase HypF [Brotomerdimonas butyrica]MCU6756968.1 carbamoyltransferase HypF [Brotomerdimonas butyrica]SCI09693.1 Carbamoyltransferase hypF [uncultured Eubacterium sp.]